MDVFDQKIKEAASEEMKHAAVPEKTQKEIDLLLERLSERETKHHNSFRWQPAGLAFACAVAAAVVILPAVNHGSSNLLAGIGSNSGAGTSAAAENAAEDTSDYQDIIAAEGTADIRSTAVLERYCKDTGIPEEQAECSEVSSYGNWVSYEAETLDNDTVRYYTWNEEDGEIVDLDDLFASENGADEVWADIDMEQARGWIVNTDGNLLLVDENGTYPADLEQYLSLLKESYQESFH